MYETVSAELSLLRLCRVVTDEDEVNVQANCLSEGALRIRYTLHIKLYTLYYQPGF